ncbi:metallophosphoesterase family protein [Pseudoduganella violaceinigra]|uniref:metallophosphoesterase family protein n=1 Tax=Pseudoduganella violaceinigra TaxID=246602 RepID=UPI0006855A22|nr:metallophosphoesterase [Pseudoduganella violaceinigra]
MKRRILPWLAAAPALAAQAAALAEGAPAAARPLVVYAAGDIADCRYSRAADSGAAATAALIAKGDPHALILSLGDHTYPNGTPAEFRDCYAPTWGQFRERTRPAPGNHEYGSGRADGYFDYFGELAGPRGRGYYSFDKSGWHFISLNSDLDAASHQRQLVWLKDDLAASKTRCALAYWHAPMYSSGGHVPTTRMQDVWRVLHEAGVELVLSGHDHDYERLAPMDADGRPDPMRGVRQFVVGTGGAFLTPFLWINSQSEARFNWRTGVLKLVLKESGYEWEFLAVAPKTEPEHPQQEARDSGAANCH